MTDEKHESEELEHVNEQPLQDDELTEQALDTISGGLDFDPQPDPPKVSSLKMNYMRKSGEL